MKDKFKAIYDSIPVTRWTRGKFTLCVDVKPSEHLDDVTHSVTITYDLKSAGDNPIKSQVIQQITGCSNDYAEDVASAVNFMLAAIYEDSVKVVQYTIWALDALVDLSYQETLLYLAKVSILLSVIDPEDQCGAGWVDWLMDVKELVEDEMGGKMGEDWAD